MSLRRKLGWDEVERETGIARTVDPALTQRDVRNLERKMLGRTWGQRRRKFTGPR